jgi:hypothetical protein
VLKIMSVSLSFRASGEANMVEVGDPKPLFEARVNSYNPQVSTYFYSVSKDGNKFLINHVDSTTEPVLNIVVNWQQAFSR